MAFNGVRAGFEEKSLSNPHFRSSLSGLQHSAKVLRVYFCRCDSCWRERLSASDEFCDHSIAHKSFHVTLRPVPCSRLDFSSCNVNLQVQLEPSVLSQMNDWIEQSGTSLENWLSHFITFNSRERCVLLNVHSVDHLFDFSCSRSLKTIGDKFGWNFKGPLTMDLAQILNSSTHCRTQEEHIWVLTLFELERPTLAWHPISWSWLPCMFHPWCSTRISMLELIGKLSKIYTLTSALLFLSVLTAIFRVDLG